MKGSTMGFADWLFCTVVIILASLGLAVALGVSIWAGACLGILVNTAITALRT